MPQSLKDEIKPIIHRIAKEVWNVQPEEKILVLTDFPSSNDFVEKDETLLLSMINRNILAKTIYKSLIEILDNDIDIYFISLEDLIINKKTAARDRDILDLKYLEKITKIQK